MTLSGLAVSPGLAVGQAFVYRDILHDLERYDIGTHQVEYEHARIERAVGKVLVHVLAQDLEERVRFGEVLAGGAVALVEVGDGVEAHAVDAQFEPEVERVEDGALDGRRVIVEIGLMRIEAMPVERLGGRVPGPVGVLEVLEDDAGVLELVGRVVPDVVAARAPPGARRALEPRMLIGGVIDDRSVITVCRRWPAALP